MSTETDTATGDGGVTAPVVETPAVKAPTNDTEAALLEKPAEVKPEDDAAKKTAEAEERKKNRTRDYINRINREAAELRTKTAELEARLAQTQQPRQPAQAAQGEPTIEDFDFDPIAFQRAHSKWSVESALKERDERAQQEESTKRQTEVLTTYQERINTFADEHPDFHEVVGSIPYPLHPDVQLAVMAHEKGAEIAYHLGNNDDEAFALASIQPQLAAAAVERLASRLTAAPSVPPPATPVPAAVIPPALVKPISNAPAPAPTLGGRSASETPAEKLTDDEWYAKERERNRKR